MHGEAGAGRTVTVWKWVSLLLLPAAFALSVWAAGAPPSSSSARTAARAETKGFAQRIVARGFPTAFLTSTPTNTATSTATSTSTPTNTPTSTATATVIVQPPTAPEIPTLSEVGTAVLILCLLGVAVLHLLRTRQ